MSSPIVDGSGGGSGIDKDALKAKLLKKLQEMQNGKAASSGSPVPSSTKPSSPIQNANWERMDDGTKRIKAEDLQKAFNDMIVKDMKDNVGKVVIDLDTNKNGKIDENDQAVKDISRKAVDEVNADKDNYVTDQEIDQLPSYKDALAEPPLYEQAPPYKK